MMVDGETIRMGVVTRDLTEILKVKVTTEADKVTVVEITTMEASDNLNHSKTILRVDSISRTTTEIPKKIMDTRMIIHKTKVRTTKMGMVIDLTNRIPSNLNKKTLYMSVMSITQQKKKISLIS